MPPAPQRSGRSSCDYSHPVLDARVKTGIAIAAAFAFLVPPAAAQELPNFVFRDAVAGAVADPKAIGDGCLPTDVPNERRCLELGANVADQKLRWLVALTYNHRLTSLMGIFEPVSLEALAKAFTAQYGQPCSTETVASQSVTGAPSHATKLIWCFKTGQLVMQAPGNKIPEGYFVYIDEWQPPGPSP